MARWLIKPPRIPFGLHCSHCPVRYLHFPSRLKWEMAGLGYISQHHCLHNFPSILTSIRSRSFLSYLVHSVSASRLPFPWFSRAHKSRPLFPTILPFSSPALPRHQSSSITTPIYLDLPFIFFPSIRYDCDTCLAWEREDIHPPPHASPVGLDCLDRQGQQGKHGAKVTRHHLSFRLLLAS